MPVHLAGRGKKAKNVKGKSNAKARKINQNHIQLPEATYDC